jgi:ribosomal protein S18 acetylase RimI-like enzyme
MSLHIINNDKLKSTNLALFTTVIYKNFIHLTQYKNLQHTKQEIYRILTSDTAKVILIMVNKTIAAYLIGEIMSLHDGRSVFYVNYIYTSKLFRNRGFGSSLMKVVENTVKNDGLDGIMLTCDTENKTVYIFYLKKGFMPDLILRRYEKHEVLYK